MEVTTNPMFNPSACDSVSSVERSASTGDAESSANQSSRASGVESENDLRRKIIQEEERNVRRARCLVGVAFFICTISVTTAVYLFTRQSDQQAFESAVSRPSQCHKQPDCFGSECRPIRLNTYSYSLANSTKNISLTSCPWWYGELDTTLLLWNS